MGFNAVGQPDTIGQYWLKQRRQLTFLAAKTLPGRSMAQAGDSADRSGIHFIDSAKPRA